MQCTQPGAAAESLPAGEMQHVSESFTLYSSHSIQAPEIELFTPLSPSSAPSWNNCVGSRRWSWTDPTNRPRLGPAFWWGLKEAILAHQRDRHTVIMLWAFKNTLDTYITHFLWHLPLFSFSSYQCVLTTNFILTYGSNPKVVEPRKILEKDTNPIQIQT